MGLQIICNRLYCPDSQRGETLADVPVWPSRVVADLLLSGGKAESRPAG